MNQVTTKKEGALAVNMFEADANQGAQNIAQDDLALPFLKVLGQLSPEINKTHSKFIKGAEAGMILNSVSGELFNGEEGIEVLPVFYKRQYVEWADRGASTGAPVAIHEADSDIISQTTRDKSYKDRLPNGNYLENTKWNSMMMGIKMQGKNGLFTPPTYSHIYKLKTVQMSNDKGTWFGWDVSKVGPVSDKGVYEIAKNFAERVGKGEIEAKPEVQEETKKSLNL
jgi:hypothetical protein